MFWVIALSLAAASAWFISRPLLGPGTAPPARGLHALEVYRDQIAEIERDLERGQITAAQAAAARTEIERRILGAAEAADVDPAAPAGGAGAWVPAAVGALVPVAAIAVYLALGSPHLPGSPFDAQAQRSQAAAEPHEFEAMVTRLAQRLVQAPDDREGWTMLGRSYAYLDRHADAAESYRRALALNGDDPDLFAAYGEALALANDGIVTPPARAAFETALRSRPDDLRARFYLALAFEQAGQWQEALDRFTGLARGAPPDASWLPVIRTHIETVAKKLGLDPRQVAAQNASANAPPAAGGFIPMPTGAESLAAMPAGEVEAFMRQRVEALADRLRAEPDDIDGWLRLARSYRVLGDMPKSREAIAAAGRAADKKGPEARAAVDETARQLGLAEVTPAR